MAKLWAIAIGINQYQYFQSLGYAQADAEGIGDFLVKQASFPESQCLLMTDSSVPIEDKPTLPTKNNILKLLEDLAASSWEPQDKLWFFFSGYGINYQGQDYLMPIDGDSKRIHETGIEMRELMQTLQLAGLEVLLLLDFNRALGTQADSSIGQETIELAQELQISTILSCQPEQFSHESSELGHGFFTAALLEALRYGNTNNLAGLENYLSARTPELCQHHWRPTQNPITFIVSPEQTLFEQDIVNSLNIVDSREAFTARAAPKLEEKPDHNNNSSAVAEAPTENSPPHTDTPTSTKETQSVKQKAQSNNPLGKSLLLWGAGTFFVGGLLLVVFLRHQSGFKIEEIFQISDNNSRSITVLKPLPNNLARLEKRESNQPQRSNSNLQKTSQAMLDLEKMSLNANQASDLNKAIARAKNIKPGEAGYKQAQKNIKIWSSMILDLAKNRAENMEYASAIAAAELISQQESNYRPAQAAIKQWRSEAKQYLSNKTLLEAAQSLIQPSQASSYNRAIEVAKRIPQSQAGFAMAQKSIDKWSLEILKLAKIRANKKQFSSAIATATLAPEGTAAYAEAHQLIKQWQQLSTEKLR